MREKQAMNRWIEFWDGRHDIYVDDRHKALHADMVATGIVGHVPRPAATVLDFGCGEALYADKVRAACGRLILCDAAHSLRDDLERRLAGHEGISVIAPEDLSELPDRSLDLIIVNSVLQYVDRATTMNLLAVWRSKLTDDGRLVCADIIPPNVHVLTDVAALLRFAWSGHFVVPAMIGLARTAGSSYVRLRRDVGLSMYDEPSLCALFAAGGFAARRVYPNIGHNQVRMTFVARKQVDA
jgi:SAM-dependent methyltransferase